MNDKLHEAITLVEAAQEYSIPYQTLATAARTDRLWSRRSGDRAVLTTRAAVEEAIAEGKLTPGDGDRTNRYRKPGKREAYEQALTLAEGMSNLLLWTPQAYLEIFSKIVSDLPREDRRQVAAKAVRVVRGRRRKAERSEA